MTEALAQLEGLERGPAGNTSLAAAFVIAQELDQRRGRRRPGDRVHGGGQAPDRAAHVRPASWASRCAAGTRARTCPGAVIAIPRSPERALGRGDRPRRDPPLVPAPGGRAAAGRRSRRGRARVPRGRGERRSRPRSSAWLAEPASRERRPVGRRERVDRVHGSVPFGPSAGSRARSSRRRPGVSRGLISQVELDRANPSIDTLRRIAAALESPIASFFDEAPANGDRRARATSARTMRVPRSGLTYQLLTPDLNRQIEFILIELEPGSGRHACRLRPRRARRRRSCSRGSSTSGSARRSTCSRPATRSRSTPACRTGSRNLGDDADRARLGDHPAAFLTERSGRVKCFVLFRLKPGVTPEQYEDVVPRGQRAGRPRRCGRSRATASGGSRASWRASRRSSTSRRWSSPSGPRSRARSRRSPEMAAMLEDWYARVADQVIVFAEEVAQALGSPAGRAASRAGLDGEREPRSRRSEPGRRSTARRDAGSGRRSSRRIRLECAAPSDGARRLLRERAARVQVAIPLREVGAADLRGGAGGPAGMRTPTGPRSIRYS